MRCCAAAGRWSPTLRSRPAPPPSGRSPPRSPSWRRCPKRRSTGSPRRDRARRPWSSCSASTAGGPASPAPTSIPRRWRRACWQPARSTPVGLGTVVVHLPRRLAVGEADLLGALSAHVPVHAVVGFTGDPQVDALATDLLAALAGPLGADAPARPEGIARPLPTRLVWAPDPAEEAAIAVREVVAAIRGTDGRAPVRPERIAVVHRVRDPWANLLHAALGAAEVPHHARSTTTLAQSIPGRVARAVLAVAAEGFRRADIAVLWRSGPVLDPVSGHLVPTSWDAVARAAGVRGGVDEWHQRLALARDERLRDLDRRSDVSHTEPFDPGDAPGATDWRVARIDELDAHITWLDEHLQPPDEPTWAAWAAWLRRVARRTARRLRRPTRAQRGGRGPGVVGRRLARPPRRRRTSHPTSSACAGCSSPSSTDPTRATGGSATACWSAGWSTSSAPTSTSSWSSAPSDGELPPRRREDPLLPDRVRERAGGLLAPAEPPPRRGAPRPAGGARRRSCRGPARPPCRARASSASASPRPGSSRPHPSWPAAWSPARSWRASTASPGSTGIAVLRGRPSPCPPPRSSSTSATSSPTTVPVGCAIGRGGRGRHAPGAWPRRGAARGEGRFDEWSGSRRARRPLARAAFDRPQSATGLEAYATCPFRYLLAHRAQRRRRRRPHRGRRSSRRSTRARSSTRCSSGSSAGTSGKPPDEPWSGGERAACSTTSLDRGRRRATSAEGRTGPAAAVGRAPRRAPPPAPPRPRRATMCCGRRRARSPAGRRAALRRRRGGAAHGASLASGGRAIAFKGIIDRVDRSRRRPTRSSSTTTRPGRRRRFGKVKAAIEARRPHRPAARSSSSRSTPSPPGPPTPAADEVAAHYWFVGRRERRQRRRRGHEPTTTSGSETVIDVVVDGIEHGSFPANPGDESWRLRPVDPRPTAPGATSTASAPPPGRGVGAVAHRAAAAPLRRSWPRARRDGPDGGTGDELSCARPERPGQRRERPRPQPLRRGRRRNRQDHHAGQARSCAWSPPAVSRSPASSPPSPSPRPPRPSCATASAPRSSAGADRGRSRRPDDERGRVRRGGSRIDEAVITTLHGFAQRILAEHPVAAGLPPAFEVDEGIAAELEFVERWSAFVDRLLADPDAHRGPRARGHPRPAPRPARTRSPGAEGPLGPAREPDGPPAASRPARRTLGPVVAELDAAVDLLAGARRLDARRQAGRASSCGPRPGAGAPRPPRPASPATRSRCSASLDGLSWPERGGQRPGGLGQGAQGRGPRAPAGGIRAPARACSRRCGRAVLEPGCRRS